MNGRRNFISRFAAGVTAVTAAIGVGGVPLGAQTETWQPARHEEDDWLDRIPGKHRLIFDTTAPDGFGQSMLFARNYIAVNQDRYKVSAKELAIVIVARHLSTAFAFNDAMWAKYGLPLSVGLSFTDPKTRLAPKSNLYNSSTHTELLSRGVTLDSLFESGVQLAVCEVATASMASVIASAIGADFARINEELRGNLVKNSRLVPAGIVTVDRAQERGYSFVRS